MKGPQVLAVSQEHLTSLLAIDAAGAAHAQACGQVTHVFSHIHHTYHIRCVHVPKACASSSADVRWLTEAEIGASSVPTNMKKVLQQHTHACRPNGGGGGGGEAAEAASPPRKRRKANPDCSQPKLDAFFKSTKQ